MLDAAILRSNVPHALIRALDVGSACALDGVHAVYTAASLRGRVDDFTRSFYPGVSPVLAEQYSLKVAPYRAQLLAKDRVYRVGEPIAVVVATSRATAEDACELIAVDYEELPIVADAESGLRPEAMQIHSDVPGNVAAEFTIRVGDVQAALETAPRRLRERFTSHRSVGSPMETRGVLADFDSRTGQLTEWTANQRPHLLRSYLSEMLHLPESMVRVIAPDMGGSFGGGIYSEEILLGFAAMDLGRPVRWIEDRSENLQNARHSRDQTHDVEIGFDDDGKILALRDTFLVDTGCYNPFGITLPFNTAVHLRGEHDIPHFEAHAVSVFTNKLQTTPLRGAGRPEAAFVMDRLLHLVAEETEIDAVEVRRRNLIPANRMPYNAGMHYRDGAPTIYDSGNFPEQLEMAVELSDYRRFRSRQAEAGVAGRLLGIGFSSHVEGSGYGPYEGASATIDSSGHVLVTSGSSPHGQSHETTLAQVASDALGVPFDSISVLAGDTSLIAYGGGTFASRSAVTAGSAVHLAATRLKARTIRAAAGVLGVEPSDLDVVDGKVVSAESGDSMLTLSQVQAATAPDSAWCTERREPAGLQEVAYFVPSAVTFSSATHVAEVEVDAETGFVRVIRYAVVDECGRVINPRIVDGQQIGGVAHGIGNALFEEVVYQDGVPINASYMDYLLPTAAEVPRVDLAHQCCPSPLNPIGVKGCGEGGTVSAPGAIANAVADALHPLRLRITEVPITPQRLLGWIEEARQQEPQAPTKPGNSGSLGRSR